MPLLGLLGSECCLEMPAVTDAGACDSETLLDLLFDLLGSSNDQC